jgi:agmatinase
MREIGSRFLPALPPSAAPAAVPLAVLPIPYERTTSFGKGAAAGPAAILAASAHVELFDEELLLPLDLAVETLPAMDGDSGDDEAALARIRDSARSVLASGRFLLSLGGEHTITAPLVEAARSVHGPLTVLQVDAHTDLRDVYTGTRRSHGCVMRRVLDQGTPVVAVGIRSFSREEYDLIRARRLPVFLARDLAAAPDDAWMDCVLEALGPEVYLTVDIDGLDPAVAPGTGTPEPGGLGWYPLLRLLRRVAARRRLVAADIVEVAPSPGQSVAEYAAARLGAKILLYRTLAAAGRLTALEEPPCQGPRITSTCSK